MNLYLYIDPNKNIHLKQYIFSANKILGQKYLASRLDSKWAVSVLRTYLYVSKECDDDTLDMIAENSYEIDQLGIPILITGKLLMPENSEYLYNICNSYLYYVNIFNHYSSTSQLKQGEIVFKFNDIDKHSVVDIKTKNFKITNLVTEVFNPTWVRLTNVTFPNILTTKII